MKKPYIKEFLKISGFKIYLVDGKFIRTNIDEEFTNFGQHYRFKFIPKNEFWIDNERKKGEEKFYINHLLIENSLMKKGKSYAEALKKADRKERRERKCSGYFLKKINGIVSRKEEINKIRVNLIKKYSKGIKVWVVDGELVRDLFDIDFTEGGHGMVYPYIPKEEVWIDDDVSIKERKFVILHEIHERNLMLKGWEYNPAHKDSSKIEFYCRKHKKEIDKKIMAELKK